MRYLFKFPATSGEYVEIAGPVNSPLRYLSLGCLCLHKAGSHFASVANEKESAFCVLTGRCTIRVYEGRREANSFDLERSSPFTEGPVVAYIPQGMAYRVTSTSSILDARVIATPARQRTRPFISDLRLHKPEPFGMDNWLRSVYLPIGPGHEADRLIVGETHSPSGNWSSFPPHKHDVHDPPAELPAEEFYHYQFDPPQGFACQRLYTDPQDREPLSEVYVVEHGDTVVIPRGYHPVVVAPGYRMVTLWAFAIDERVMGAWRQDPRHAWLGSERGRVSQ